MLIFLFLGSIVSFGNGFFESEPNDCEMTYMYYTPKYMDVGFNYGNYGYSLWLYGEAYYYLNFINKREVNGFPVIFVPGNAGSGKQARSIGSLLQNKTTLRNPGFHFDTFALDFNEEFSGLNSKAIQRQADYLEKAVEYIWDMYRVPPPGIIFIGHSMGGIVIRQVIGKDGFNLDKVAFVLTLSTPHLRPPILMDSEMYNFWNDIDKSWNSSKLLNSHVRLISISSGMKDDLIAEVLTKSDLPTIYHFSSTGIDRVWLEADHKAIVWCNQLVRQNSRIIFEFAENPTKFKENVDLVILNHFQGPQRNLKKLNPVKENVKDYFQVCQKNAKCEGKGYVKFRKNADLVLVLGKASGSELISIVNGGINCRIKTRYLTMDNFYSLILPDDCAGSDFVTNTNSSKFWRKFKISRGIVKMEVYSTRSDVYRVTVERSCPGKVGGIHRVFFETRSGIRRFSRTEGKKSWLKIRNSEGDSGVLYFLDSEDCEYNLENLLEWVAYLPFLILVNLVFVEFELLSSMYFLKATVLLVHTAVMAVSFEFLNVPYFMKFVGLLLALAIRMASDRWSNFWRSRMKQPETNDQSLKLFFTLLISLPGTVTMIDFLKHGSGFQFPSVGYTVSSIFFWIHTVVPGGSNLSVLTVVIPFIVQYWAGINDFGFYFYSIEASCIMTYGVYVLFLKYG